MRPLPATGRPAIHTPDESWGTGEVESVKLVDGEAVGADELIDTAIEMAPDSDNLLKRIETILPCRQGRKITPAVFKKDKGRLWFEYSPDLAKGRRQVADRAERKSGHDAVERVVREGEPALGIELETIYRHRRIGDAGGDELFQHQLGIDDRQFSNRCRKVGQVEAGAKADLKSLSTSRLQCLTAETPNLIVTQHAVEQPGKYSPRIDFSQHQQTLLKQHNP